MTVRSFHSCTRRAHIEFCHSKTYRICRRQIYRVCRQANISSAKRISCRQAFHEAKLHFMAKPFHAVRHFILALAECISSFATAKHIEFAEGKYIEFAVRQTYRFFCVLLRARYALRARYVLRTRYALRARYVLRTRYALRA